MLKNFLKFYSSYFTRFVIIVSISAAIFSLIFVDLNSIFYVEWNSSMVPKRDYLPEKLLGVPNLMFLIFLTSVKSFIAIFALLMVLLIHFFNQIKDIIFLFVSSFFIKIWLAIFTLNNLILNLGFVKICRGMTDVEKLDFLINLKSGFIHNIQDLPADIQKILNPAIFKESTLMYLNTLNKAFPDEVLKIHILNSISNYLWDNKISIILGILNILVLAALNAKININAADFAVYSKSNNSCLNGVSEALTELKENTDSSNLAIQLLNNNQDTTNDSIVILANSLNLLNKFNEQNINLNISNYEISFLNLILLILKKLLINKKK